MDLTTLAAQIAVELIRKSGVREWDDEDVSQQIAATAASMANAIFDGLYPPELFMANKILVPEADGTPKQICFRDATDFSPTAANDLRDANSPTLVQFNFESVTNGSYRQSTKADLGALRAPAYKVRAAMEIGATPTAGNVISAWWAPSQSATAGTGNAGAVSGADGAYTGYSSNPAASVLQLDFIGNFICTAQATGTIQVAEIGILVPSERYGSLVLLNGSGATMFTDAAEIHVVFDPIFDQVQ